VNFLEEIDEFVGRLEVAWVADRGAKEAD